MTVKPKFGTFRNDHITGTSHPDFIISLAGNDTILGLAGSDFILAGSGNDHADGGSGSDLIYGGSGHDTLLGGLGNDRLFGGSGNDMLEGGSGDDVLIGGKGADKFFFDPSNADEGNDRIRDFQLGQDKISLNAADILRGDSDLITQTGDASLLEASDFDADSDWKVISSSDGDVVVIHPTGKIELDGIKFGSGTDSFAELLPALELTGVVAGTPGNNNLVGGNGDQAIFGLAGHDTIEGGRGDDALVGGLGSDRFVFNPNRDGEGDDVILDFDIGGGDKIVLAVADVLASTPGLLALSGDPAAFESTDLDASDLWDIVASHDGDTVVVHPNGTIEINGLTFSTALDFGALLPAIELV